MLSRHLQRRAKRVFDIVGASAGLAVLAPVLGVTAAAVRVSMGAPVLFRQRRPGRHGASFELLKFRTMAVARAGQGLESDGARLTAVGSLLRSLSVDELPSLWNVLKGDMSLVGPRPLLEQYLDRYTTEQARRHEATPGVTGWAQVNGRNAISWEEKFCLDVWYVDNWSLGLDVKIVYLTLLKVIARADISADDAPTMTEFLGSTREGE